MVAESGSQRWALFAGRLLELVRFVPSSDQATTCYSDTHTRTLTFLSHFPLSQGKRALCGL